MGERISLREFARRDGCNEKLVRRARGEGRLPVDADGKLDADLVGTAWRRGNADGADAVVRSQAAAQTLDGAADAGAPAPAPVASGNDAASPRRDPTYGQALAKKEHFLAETRELEFRQRRGELIELQLARQVLFDESRRGRDHWLNWPARVAATIAAELGVEADRVADVLTSHVLKHLAELSQPDGHELDPA